MINAADSFSYINKLFVILKKKKFKKKKNSVEKFEINFGLNF